MEIQWPLLIFSVLLGLSSGIFVFQAIGEIKGMFKNVRFMGSLIALISLVIGGCASVFHLGHPTRATHLLENLGSGLSTELFVTFAMGVVLIIYLILAKRDYPGASRATGVIGGLLGLALPFVAGASYMMAARPAWDSVTLPLLYVGGGLAMGFLLMCVLVMRGDKAEEEGKFALKMAICAVVIMVVTVIAYLVWVAMAPYQRDSRSLMRLMAGDLAIAFWLGAIIIGVIAPLALVLISQKKATPTIQRNLWIALACTTAGTIVMRILIYLIGTSVEQFIYM